MEISKQVYKNAPISEVILGRYYSGNLYSVDIIVKLNELFSKDYPNVHACQPLIIEFLNANGVVKNIPNFDFVPVLYRRFAQDNSYLIQLQSNCFYLNWIRQDNQKVGNYPGFEAVYKKYQEEYKKVVETTGIQNQNEEILELSYIDRFPYSSLEDIYFYLTLEKPQFLDKDNYFAINLNYVLHLTELNGCAFISIATVKGENGHPMIETRYIIRGQVNINSELNSAEKWYKAAHIQQKDFFDNMFTEKAKEAWNV